MALKVRERVSIRIEGTGEIGTQSTHASSPPPPFTLVEGTQMCQQPIKAYSLFMLIFLSYNAKLLQVQVNIWLYSITL